MTRTGRTTLLAALLCLPLAGGCSKKITIRQVPEFYQPEIQTILVAPFANRTPSPNAGQMVADRLANALRANGTYKVISYRELNLPPAQLQALEDPRAAADMARQRGAQAALVGTVTDFSSTSNMVEAYSEPYYEPYYYPYEPYYYGGYYRYHSYWGYGGYRMYFVTRNQGHVAAEVEMIAGDGTVIYALPAPARATVISDGSPPRLSPAGCVSRAADRAALQLTAEFAVVPREIKLDPGKALQIASAQDWPGWRYSHSFKSGDEKMFLVVTLPAICVRNAFRLQIRRKGGGVIAYQDFAWPRQDEGMGFEFSPNRLFAGGGEGDYVATLLYNGKVVADRDFKITQGPSRPPEPTARPARSAKTQPPPRPTVTTTPPSTPTTRPIMTPPPPATATTRPAK